MDEAEKEQIRQRTDIVELISGYTALKKAGGRFKGLCPFHQERTPSFTVDPILGRWHCFGACQTGGDIFSFLMRAEGLTFPEAMERLAERAGIVLTRGASPEAAKQTQNERERLFAVNALAQRFFRETFAHARMARDYAAERGLMHETIEAFGIGFAPDDWSALAEALRRQGARLDDAEKAGLVFPSRRGDDSWTDRFRGRLIFPIHDLQERVVAFGGRLLVPAENAPKYLNSPETPLFSKSRTLYALQRARKAIQEKDRALVVEGYMDVVAAHQAGIAHVIAPLGTALTEAHVNLLGRYTKNIVLSFDADEAGMRAALRAAELFAAAGPDFQLRVLVLPPGDDPDSLLRRGDVATFRRAIDQALSVPEFHLQVLERRFDLHDERGRLDFLREALPILAEVPSAMEQDRLIRRLAPLHPAFAGGGGRAEESLRTEIRRRRGAPLEDSLPPAPRPAPTGGLRRPYRREPAPPPRPQPPPSEIEQAGRSAASEAERTLLAALLTDEWAPAVTARAAGAALLGLFADPEWLPLASALVVGLQQGAPPSRILPLLPDGPLRDGADRLLLAGPAAEPLSEEVVRDCIVCLERRRLQEANRQIEAAPSEGNNDLDAEQLRRWAENARRMKGKGADGADRA